MLETVYAQFRFAASLLFARPFHLPSLNRLVEALRETYREFGSLTSETNELMAGPTLDEETRRDIQLRRFRTQATRGARETAHYAALFERLGLNPKRLTYEQIGQVPAATKATLREQAAAFIRVNQQPTLRTMTTGTTGKPASMYFTPREMELFSILGAVSFLLQGTMTPADIIQVSTSARAALANTVFMQACQRLGAPVYQTGLIEPAQSLALLAEKSPLKGKKSRPSLLLTYPSYLGKLVETGLKLGYGPAHFGLERIILGGR